MADERDASNDAVEEPIDPKRPPPTRRERASNLAPQPGGFVLEPAPAPQQPATEGRQPYASLADAAKQRTETLAEQAPSRREPPPTTPVQDQSWRAAVEGQISFWLQTEARYAAALDQATHLDAPATLLIERAIDEGLVQHGDNGDGRPTTDVSRPSDPREQEAPTVEDRAHGAGSQQEYDWRTAAFEAARHLLDEAQSAHPSVEREAPVSEQEHNEATRERTDARRDRLANDFQRAARDVACSVMRPACRERDDDGGRELWPARCRLGGVYSIGRATELPLRADGPAAVQRTVSSCHNQKRAFTDHPACGVFRGTASCWARPPATFRAHNM